MNEPLLIVFFLIATIQLAVDINISEIRKKQVEGAVLLWGIYGSLALGGILFNIYSVEIGIGILVGAIFLEIIIKG